MTFLLPSFIPKGGSLYFKASQIVLKPHFKPNSYHRTWETSPTINQCIRVHVEIIHMCMKTFILLVVGRCLEDPCILMHLKSAHS